MPIEHYRILHMCKADRYDKNIYWDAPAWIKCQRCSQELPNINTVHLCAYEELIHLSPCECRVYWGKRAYVNFFNLEYAGEHFECTTCYRLRTPKEDWTR